MQGEQSVWEMPQLLRQHATKPLAGTSDESFLLDAEPIYRSNESRDRTSQHHGHGAAASQVITADLLRNGSNGMSTSQARLARTIKDDLQALLEEDGDMTWGAVVHEHTQPTSRTETRSTFLLPPPRPVPKLRPSKALPLPSLVLGRDRQRSTDPVVAVVKPVEAPGQDGSVGEDSPTDEQLRVVAPSLATVSHGRIKVGWLGPRITAIASITEKQPLTAVPSQKHRAHELPQPSDHALLRNAALSSFLDEKRLDASSTNPAKTRTPDPKHDIDTVASHQPKHARLSSDFDFEPKVFGGDDSLRKSIRDRSRRDENRAGPSDLQQDVRTGRDRRGIGAKESSAKNTNVTEGILRVAQAPPSCKATHAARGTCEETPCDAVSSVVTSYDRKQTSPTKPKKQREGAFLETQDRGNPPDLDDVSAKVSGETTKARSFFARLKSKSQLVEENAVNATGIIPPAASSGRLADSLEVSPPQLPAKSCVEDGDQRSAQAVPVEDSFVEAPARSVEDVQPEAAKTTDEANRKDDVATESITQVTVPSGKDTIRHQQDALTAPSTMAAPYDAAIQSTPSALLPQAVNSSTGADPLPGLSVTSRPSAVRSAPSLSRPIKPPIKTVHIRGRQHDSEDVSARGIDADSTGRATTMPPAVKAPTAPSTRPPLAASRNRQNVDSSSKPLCDNQPPKKPVSFAFTTGKLTGSASKAAPSFHFDVPKIERKASSVVKIPDFAAAHRAAEAKRLKALAQGQTRLTKVAGGHTPGRISRMRMAERAEYDKANREYHRQREAARQRFMKEQQERELAAEKAWREEHGFKALPLPDYLR